MLNVYCLSPLKLGFLLIYTLKFLGPSTSGRDCTDGAGYKDPEYEVLPGDSKENKNMDGRDPDYETVPSGSQSREPGYETLPSRFRAGVLISFINFTIWKEYVHYL